MAKLPAKIETTSNKNPQTVCLDKIKPLTYLDSCLYYWLKFNSSRYSLAKVHIIYHVSNISIDHALFFYSTLYTISTWI